MSWPLLAVLVVLMMAALMALAHLGQMRLGDGGWTDVFWSLAVGFTAALAALVPLQGEAGFSLRRLVFALAILVWALRLGGHIARRTRGGPEDARYARIRAEAGPDFGRRMAVFLQVQGLAGSVFALTVALAAHAPRALGAPLDWLGGLIALLGLGVEALADAQLVRFRAAGGPGRVCDSGLWSISRHPNYVGEWLFWLGWSLCALFPGGGYGVGWLALFAPVFSYLLLRHVSGVPLLEPVMLASRGAAYSAYQRRVSVFFPLPPARYFILFGFTLVVFAGLDAVWLSASYAPLYQPVIGPYMAFHPDVTAALLFYVIFIGALTVYAVEPGLEQPHLWRAGLRCAGFGFAAYATYDLTNQATLARWSWVLTGCDLVWGSAASGLAGMAALSLARRLKLVEGARP